MNLQVNGINFKYNGHAVLRDIDFQVGKGEFLAILGPNGAGKTTLLKCLNAIHKPTSGSVIISKQDVFKLNSDKIAKLLGYVPQRIEAARLTVFDTILMGRKPYIKWRVGDNDVRIVDSAIKMLSLQHLSLRCIDQLSGGELQKVSIARAFVQEPEVLLLDEPTSSLDLKNQLEILHAVKNIVKEHRVTAVMTMHDLNTALRFADKYIFLKDGLIFAHGGQECVTPNVIHAVYDVPVEIEYRNGTPVIFPIEDCSGLAD
ncbi:ABC transporter ATP-binding protein [Desulfotalea psychrophila]|nr:ABC transporter ATP-binding protein [Desulfocapsa sp.]MBN4065516.1 ABC transporter ATP-binding protein [Desulfocapsa sp. AH-315-G09]MBN4071681.1 ABC transporter ATP-binding protein [Desulfotalea psychrophila]